ncbi:uncharacterized protein LOC135347256 isoform X2 [Halichondria panicea]|uniref:uncharacterized protein LOC135347256 isoform X2 n=1 Tax=Halichondria panicea TaxID=6063 RepID=UPI00312B37A1
MKMTSQRHASYLSNDLDDDVTLVFPKPSWQLRASLASVLITPVLYQLYFIMVTIRYILFLQTFSSPPRPACPMVDLSWTGVFPCELGWRGSALAVLILSAVLITCYSLITACLVRWNPRKQWNSTTSVFDTQEKPIKFQVRAQSTNRPPTLSLYILLLIFRLLLQSGDVEANPGPTLGSILTLGDVNFVYKNLIKAAGDWLDLGLDLGLDPGTLKDIKDECHRNKDCLREMISARLKTGPLTYSDICQSLRAPTVARNDVAEAIEEACTDDDTSPGPSKKKLSTTTPGPTMTPFDADSHFTMRAIDRLKVSAGISVKEELVQHTSPTAFLAVAGVDVWEMYNYILGEWESGRGPHPPTWTELFRVLKEIGLSELAGRIEKYLRGSVPEDPPRPPPDEEGDSEEEKDDETPKQENLRLNNVLAEYISANILLKNIQLKKANINLEHHLKSEKVKEEQLDPASIKEEPTFDKNNQSPSSPLKHIKQETKADPQTTKVKSEEPVSQLLPLGLSTVQHHAIPFNLPGVEVVASTCVIVTNSPQTFHWDGYGFKLTIPQGSLPAGVDQCRLDIKASVAGQYLFPNNLQLVSGVFWIRPLPSGRFQQQLTVEIQHCAKMTSSTKLSFVRAHCSQESLPYTFKHLEGCGSFTEHSSYGSLELSQFSGLAVTGENVERVYTASLYYLGSELYSREIHFVVNWDNDIHNTFVSEKYSTKEAILGVNHFVEFEGDRITLDIPIDGTKVKGGWKITPMFHPTVIKKNVDQFKPGQRIPHCHLKAEITNKRRKSAPKLSHKVNLLGAKDPFQFTTIDLDLQSTLPQSKPSTIIGVKRKKEDKKDESGRPTLGSILTLDDLGSVNEKLIKVAGNWKELGLALGLHSGTLKNIEQDYRKSKDYLREMLTVCLETANLTYSKICQSLRAPAVRQDALADAIKEEFTDDDTSPGPSKTPKLSSGPTMQ